MESPLETPEPGTGPDHDHGPAGSARLDGPPATIGTETVGSVGGPDGPTIPFTALIGAAGAAILAAVVLLVLFAGDDAETDGMTVDDLAGYAFLTDDGDEGTLADYEGEPMVVNFFASWCPPCRAELPDLEAVHLANAGTVTFLGVNHDFDEEIWRSFVTESAITYDTVFQPETEIFTALEAVGMPSTALIDGDGEIVYLHTGILTESMLQDLIDEHLDAA